ncbi:hypothetical protein P3T22_005887 [Paraburkholderia sp. GAS348]
MIGRIRYFSLPWPDGACVNHFSESIRSVPRRSAECPGLDWSLQSGARHAMEFFDHALFCIRELLVQARQHTSRFRRVDAHRPRRVDSLFCPSDFDGQLPTQAVWKPDGITMRRMTADPSGTFGCLCGHHGDDGKASLSDAFQTSLRALFQDLRGAHAPTRRIAFIVFLKPRILSTRVRL